MDSDGALLIPPASRRSLHGRAGGSGGAPAAVLLLMAQLCSLWTAWPPYVSGGSSLASHCENACAWLPRFQKSFSHCKHSAPRPHGSTRSTAQSQPPLLAAVAASRSGGGRRGKGWVIKGASSWRCAGGCPERVCLAALRGWQGGGKFCTPEDQSASCCCCTWHCLKHLSWWGSGLGM
jgi:hypothetical protein